MSHNWEKNHQILAKVQKAATFEYTSNGVLKNGKTKTEGRILAFPVIE